MFFKSYCFPVRVFLPARVSCTTTFISGGSNKWGYAKQETHNLFLIKGFSIDGDDDTLLAARIKFDISKIS